MPDLQQVSDDLFEEKMEELLEHYRYEKDLPEVDTVLNGVVEPTAEQLQEAESSVLYGFLTEVLSTAEQRSKDSLIVPQKAGHLNNVIKTLNRIYDQNPEFALLGGQMLFAHYPHLSDKEVFERVEGNEEGLRFKEWYNPFFS